VCLLCKPCIKYGICTIKRLYQTMHKPVTVCEKNYFVPCISLSAYQIIAQVKLQNFIRYKSVRIYNMNVIASISVSEMRT
jgi:ABC-type taurine transport system substrate-binding protein